MRSIVVFCGSSDGNDNQIVDATKTLGKRLAQKNITVVYGGAKIGLMGVRKTCMSVS